MAAYATSNGPVNVPVQLFLNISPSLKRNHYNYLEPNLLFSRVIK